MRLMLVLALLAPSAAYAATEPRPLPTEIRLSDEEKEKALEAAAARNRQPAVPAATQAPAAEPPARPIHGEVGFSIGTHGYRSGYGTAFVPVGEDGLAIVTLGSTDFGSRGPIFGPEWR